MRVAAHWLVLTLVALGTFAACAPRGGREDAGPDACDTRACEGDVFVSECQGEPVRVDCGEQAGTCEDGTGCMMPPSGYCDELDFFCEDGSVCVDFLCE